MKRFFMKNVIKILLWGSLLGASALRCGSEDSDIIPTYSKNFYAITDVEAPGATKVMIFNQDHWLVHAFAALSKGKNSYTLLHPEKSICAIFYGKHDDVVAHVVLFDFKTGETFLEVIDDNAPLAGCFSHDGKYFVYTRKEMMHVYDLGQRELSRVSLKDTIVEYAFLSSHNNVRCAAKLHDQKAIALVNVRTREIDEIPGGDGWVRHGVTFGNNDTMLGITSLKDDLSSTQMLVWDIQAQKPKGACQVRGIASSGTMPVPVQKMYFNSEDNWCIVNTFLPDKGNLQSYKIDLRSYKVADELRHSTDTQAIFDMVNNRTAFITNDMVSVFDWEKSSIIREFTYKRPHFVAFNNDARKLIAAYDRCRYAIEKI